MNDLPPPNPLGGEGPDPVALVRDSGLEVDNEDAFRRMARVQYRDGAWSVVLTGHMIETDSDDGLRHLHFHPADTCPLGPACPGAGDG